MDVQVEDVRVAEVRPTWLSAEDACRYTGLSRTTLWRLEAKGLVRAARYGRLVRFDRRSLDEFMEKRVPRKRAAS